ncbi:hypothetical protein E0Z10_g4297 [Xylaria hypoxylon]|uniref:Uncharacterized protein n=1 Tax=Xylaria hypoxylon TaxID=37992 RepID=A0A4Z0YJG2_9PEZI|nr:hypothetical protein E0Z10_g4297 [Xylaria hypoxylon]
MATQDVQNVIAEGDELLDTFQQGFIDINKIRDELKNNTNATDEVTGHTNTSEDNMRDNVTRLALRIRQIKEQGARLKDNTGKFNMAEWRIAMQLYNQARFDNSLHWLIAMEKDETLDRLRNMSPDHKAAILDLEQQITAEKLTKAEASLRLNDAEMRKVAGNLTSARDNIRALENDKESLETQVANLQSSARTLEQRYNSITAQYATVKDTAGSLHKRVKELEDNIAKNADRPAAQTSEVPRLTAANKALQDTLTRKDAEISDLNVRLNSEKTGHENTERQRLQANSAGRYSQREVHTLQGLVAEGLFEIDRLEETHKDMLDHFESFKELSLETSAESYLQMVVKNEELLEQKKKSAQKDTNLEQANAELDEKAAELERVKKDCAQKDTEIAHANASLLHNRAELDEKAIELDHATEDCARKDAELEQKVTQLERATEDYAQKDTDLLHCRITLEHKEADLVQRNTNLALWLMSPKHSEQDVDLWAPLIDYLQLPVPATQPAIEQCTWWAVARKQQDASAAIPALPAGLLESVALLYSEAIADQYDEDSCAPFLTIIRCLEVAKVAPIPMIMELLRRLLTSTNRDLDHMTQFGLFLGTWQVIGLIRLRWPETESLTDIEGQCQERFQHSPPDFQLIRDLVSGVDCGKQVRSAFGNDSQDKEVPSILSATPHKYCPMQKNFLVAPTTYCWALDLRCHTILLVDKEKGGFVVKDRIYRLQGAHGEEDIVVPSEENEDLDFIFGHLI